jgi:hypothetical protein
VNPSRDFFEQCRDALVGFLPRTHRSFSSRVSSRNLKVWFGNADREHYEVQVVTFKRRIHLEVGFHAEHKDRSSNDRALALLLECEPKWRRSLGPDAEAGRFIGPQSATWRRLSELWDGPDLWGPEAAVEAAARLADYIEILEPVRKQNPDRST